MVHCLLSNPITNPSKNEWIDNPNSNTYTLLEDKICSSWFASFGPSTGAASKIENNRTCHDNINCAFLRLKGLI